ncbi:MAG: right-handed parallel beta-helix repeat-containing protein [Saprospiraceae bacterium]|nr:right-handed parallel beta-helix repeat-containing protein [Saprospiraceae bacterium]
MNRYTPYESSRKIRVRANFIVIQKADGTGNFQDIPEHRAFLDDWFNRCNFRFGSLWGSPDANCSDYVIDSKVEIAPNWIFLPDPTEYYWDNTNNPGTTDCPNSGSWWLNGLDAQINNDPNIPRGINVYLTSHGPVHHQMVTLGTINHPFQAGMPYTWCSELPSITDLNKPSRIHIANLFLKYWWFQNHPDVIGEPFSVSRAWIVDEGISLAHEFGHSFIREYVHTCPCLNHLMGANCGYGAVLRKRDIQFIHRGFVFNNIRQFIECEEKYDIQDSPNETPYLWVTQDETWNVNMRLYDNVRVKSGVTLTITCQVLFPQNGHIRVERGARIIIDGGHVKRANTCSPNQFWHGIYANGNSYQPQPDPYGPLLPDQGAIVILKGDGLIEGAGIGVSTKNSPPWDTPEHRGAIIDADDFTFMDCRKGVEFMKYEFPNFSRFHNVRFERSATGSMFNGVSMWATNGVTFQDCFFKNMTQQGIISWDASYTVTKRNVFTGSPIGILGGGSMPLAGHIVIGQEGASLQDRNQFINNTVGVRGTSNTLFRIFSNYFENYDFDIAMIGQANNEIRGNRFQGAAAGVQLDNTGNFKSDLQCNVYSGNIVGVNIVENNQGFNFRNEDFTVVFHDLFIEGTATNPGRIQQFQGNSGDARWNYFSAGKPEKY